MYVILIYKNGEFYGYDSDSCTRVKNLKSAHKWDSLAEAKRWRTLLKRESPKHVFHIHKVELTDKGLVE